MDLLRDMQLFVEVAKARSFTRAAEALDMPASTVSRRIAGLERAVGLRLINRTTRHVELTEAGAAYYERCRAITDEARVAHENLRDMVTKPRGQLRLSITGDFGSIFLAPYLVIFRQLYPEITFSIDMSPRFVDLIAERYDLAIRIGPLTADSSMIARQLALLPVRLYASPEYLARRGAPQSPSDLAGHDCLSVQTATSSSSWTLMRGDEKTMVEVRGPISANSLGMLRRLALLGVGVGYIDEAMVREDLRAGRLIHVLPDWQLAPVPIHAMTATRLLPAKTRVFIEFLAEKLEEMRISGPATPS